MLKSTKLYLMRSDNNNNESLSINNNGLLNGLMKHSLYSSIFNKSMNKFKEFSIQCTSIDNKNIFDNKNNFKYNPLHSISTKENSEKNISFDLNKFMPTNKIENNFTSNSDLHKYFNKSFSNDCHEDQDKSLHYNKIFNDNKNDIDNHFKGIYNTYKNLFDDIYEKEFIDNLENLSETSDKSIINKINSEKIKKTFLCKLKTYINNN